jgi:hypothetical protein
LDFFHRAVNFGFLAGDIDVLAHLGDRRLGGGGCRLYRLAFLVFTADDVERSLAAIAGWRAQQECTNNKERRFSFLRVNFGAAQTRASPRGGSSVPAISMHGISASKKNPTLPLASVRDYRVHRVCRGRRFVYHHHVNSTRKRLKVLVRKEMTVPKQEKSAQRGAGLSVRSLKGASAEVGKLSSATRIRLGISHQHTSIARTSQAD